MTRAELKSLREAAREAHARLGDILTKDAPTLLDYAVSVGANRDMVAISAYLEVYRHVNARWEADE